jgi:hypothetical protein
MADISSTLRLWSATPASNNPAGGTTIGTGLDDNLREIQAVIRKYMASTGSNMASASTVDLATADGFYIQITGVTTITAFGTESAGIHYLLRFAGILTLTHNATSLILPGGKNITTAAGDMALMVSEGSGNWRCAAFQKASGDRITAGPLVMVYQTASGGNIPTSAYTQVPFDTETIDTNACFATSTFTPNVAGYYQINCSYAATPAASMFLAIFKNGSLYKRGHWVPLALGNTVASVSAVVDANGTTDAFDIRAFQDSGSTINVVGGATVSWLDAHFVRGL